MGVVLADAVPGLRCPEEANLRAPDAVVAVHVGFINAGADLIETNTFGANRRKLAQHYLEDEFERINSEAVKLARDAREITGREVFIGGSIGPRRGARSGAVRRPGARPRRSRRRPVHAGDVLRPRRAAHRRRGGAGGVEPPGGGAAQLRRRRGDDGRRGRARGGGAPPRRSMSRRSERTTAAGPAAALAALAEMQGGGSPLAALPNVGLATLSGSRVAFPHATPEYFAEFAARARDLGARVIGGCCGTTPAQIAAIRAAVDEQPAGRAGRPGSAPCGGGPTRRAGRADPARADARSRRVRRLGPARSPARRERRRPRRLGPADPRIGARARRRPERQPEGAGAHERRDRVGRRCSATPGSRSSRI